MHRVAILLSLSLFAQEVSKPPHFEVATIKPAKPDGDTSWHMRPGRFTATNTSLNGYITLAYDVKDRQVTGGPKWAASELYDIVAKLEDADSPLRAKAIDAETRAALKVLLAERFKLKIHEETRTTTGYALLAAKKGFKLQEVPDTTGSSTSSGNSRLNAKGASMTLLASLLAKELRMPVEDRTGIKGVFNFALKWAPDATAEKPASDQDVSALISTALQEQLGLKLEPHKMEEQVIVIDRAEKPVEN